MTPLSLEFVVQALGVLLLSVATLYIAGFSRRLSSHESQALQAVAAIAELRATLVEINRRLDRMQNTLDDIQAIRGR